METRARGRNPLFDPRLRVTPVSVAEDTPSRCIYLWVFLEHVKHSFWVVINVGVWCPTHGKAEEEVLRIFVMGLRIELWDWYKLFNKSHPEVNITTLFDLTSGMAK